MTKQKRSILVFLSFILLNSRNKNRVSWLKSFLHYLPIPWTQKSLEFGPTLSGQNPGYSKFVFIQKENRIIAQGYNGFLPGQPHTSVIRDNHEQATVHAEQNAIADCAKRGVNTKGAVCYVTH